MAKIRENPKKNITDFIQCESAGDTIEIHRGRNGYEWSGQKGKNLEWTIPVLVKKSADEILAKIYNCPEWQKTGKGKETSIDSPALREVIWNNIMPHIDIRSMLAVPRSGTNKDAMVRTQTKGKYVLETKNDILTIASNECYTFYQSVEMVADWFLNNCGKDYFQNKVVYLNADDTRSAFWLYFYNNFAKLGLKELIATHYDNSGLSCGNSETNIKQGSFFDGYWAEYNGYILRYDGRTTKRIPPIGVKSTFHGDFREPICLKIARDEADIIMTNPPFGEQWEQYVKCMLETGKKLIFWGNGTAPIYNWFMPFLNEHKVHIISDCSDNYITDHYITPTYYRKRALGFIYTTEDLSHIKPDKSHYSTKAKMLKKGTACYDDKNILLCNDAKIPTDTDEVLAVSVNIIRHGILNAGYKIASCQRYAPHIDGREKFARVLIQKI